MRILLTGGAGYLGSVLLPKLVARGHSVRLLDIGYFGFEHLRPIKPKIEIVREDIRRVLADPRFGRQLVEEADCVIHLAAISNDPSADLNPELTEDVNYRATAVLAEHARARRVRFLFSSSCSVYGEADGEVDEFGAVAPLTTYAATKVRAEEALDALTDAAWSPTILRNGTLFGYSPRMRFDLVANIFSLHSVLHNQIKIFGDGLQWRPFLHVKDCARAFVHFAEHEAPRYPRYNIAHRNLRVVDLARIFARVNPRLEVSHLDLPEPDHRDYRVSTRRMLEEGFETRTGVEMGVEELVEALVSNLIPDPESIYYRNVKWLKELTQLGSKEHRDILSLMETLSVVRTPSAS
jgi:nucleoside-diphosphate-sugar epimerase